MTWSTVKLNLHSPHELGQPTGSVRGVPKQSWLSGRSGHLLEAGARGLVTQERRLDGEICKKWDAFAEGPPRSSTPRHCEVAAVHPQHLLIAASSDPS